MFGGKKVVCPKSLLKGWLALLVDTGLCECTCSLKCECEEAMACGGEKPKVVATEGEGESLLIFACRYSIFLRLTYWKRRVASTTRPIVLKRMYGREAFERGTLKVVTSTGAPMSAIICRAASWV